MVFPPTLPQPSATVRSTPCAFDTYFSATMAGEPKSHSFGKTNYLLEPFQPSQHAGLTSQAQNFRRYRNRASFGEEFSHAMVDYESHAMNSVMENVQAHCTAPILAPVNSQRRFITARRSLAPTHSNNNFANCPASKNNNNNNLVTRRRRTIDANGEDYSSENVSFTGFQSLRVQPAAEASRPCRSPLKNVSAAFASNANIPSSAQLFAPAYRAMNPISPHPAETMVTTTCKTADNDGERVNARFLQRPYAPADVDKAVHLDDRALAALLRAEKYAQTSVAHFKTLQSEIGETLRRAAVAHMHEVSVRENADLVVLPLAVSYMDRILGQQFVPRHNLGALADAALFLALKMKAPQPPKAFHLVEGCKSRLEQLPDWEMFVVNKLDWNLATSTAFEFFDQLMVRAPILETLRQQFANTLNVMLKDLQLACLAPSLQAAACLLYVADDSHRTHLIRESETVVRRCLSVDTAQCRFQYATNIRFALSDFFFDDETESDTVTTSGSVTSRKETQRSDREVIAQDVPSDLCVEKMTVSSAELKDLAVCETSSTGPTPQITLICEESSLNDSFDVDQIADEERGEDEEELETMIIIPDEDVDEFDHFETTGQRKLVVTHRSRRPASVPILSLIGTRYEVGGGSESDDGIHTDENSNASDGPTPLNDDDFYTSLFQF